MPDTFFTSDTHFGHGNILKFCSRPFVSAAEMDEVLIQNWNSLVKKDDVVYLLGDFSFGDIKKYTDRLNGNINLILGNHDKKSQCVGNFCSVHDTLRAKIAGKYLWLSHYAHMTWPSSCYNSEHVFGHSHGRLVGVGKSFDVGTDTHGYKPYHYDEVCDIMKTLPDNKDMVDLIKFRNQI